MPPEYLSGFSICDCAGHDIESLERYHLDANVYGQRQAYIAQCSMADEATQRFIFGTQ